MRIYFSNLSTRCTICSRPTCLSTVQNFSVTGWVGPFSFPKMKKKKLNFLSIHPNIWKCVRLPLMADTDIWLGVKSEKGICIAAKTGEILSYSNIHAEGDIIKSHRSCMSFFACSSGTEYWNRLWLRTQCNSKKKIVCKFEHRSFLTIRGLCIDSPLDTKYYIDEKPINPNLRGLTHSLIRNEDYGNGSLAWKIYHQNDLIAEMSAGDLKCSYPVGKHTWQFKTDDCSNKDQPTELLITSCGLDQYTCKDGTCIDVSKKCDYEIDCEDESDEQYCNILIMPDNTIANMLPPPKLLSKSHFEVGIAVKVQRIVQLELETFSMTTDIEIILSWKDSRIKFANLRPVTTANEVDLNQSPRPWLPSFEIYGQNFSSSKRKNTRSILRVRQDNGPVEDDISRLYEGWFLTIL